MNPSNGYITGSYVNVSAKTIKLGQGALTATDAVGVGWNAGYNSSNLSVSVGSSSGANAGSSSVSLGFGAQANKDNCIVLTANGAGLISAVASSCKIDPIRDVNAKTLTSPYVIQYDDTEKELIKSVDLHTRDIECRNINNTRTLTNVSTASLYNGQLTVGVGGDKIIAGAGNNVLVVDLTNQKVGIKIATPTTTFQVGTTLYVDETTGRVGIGIPSPDENLEVDGSIQIDSNGPARLKFQQTGQIPYAVAEIDAGPDGNGGQLEFFTSNSGTGVSKKMVIRNDGATEIYSDGIGLSILSTDGTSQQAQIYHDSTGTQDLIIDTDAPATTTKGISFRTQAGVQQLRIGYFGELGFSPANNIGLQGQVLQSNGQGQPPSWEDAPTGGTTYTAGAGISISPSNVISTAATFVDTTTNQQIQGHKNFGYATGIGITGTSAWPLRVAQYGATISGPLGQYVYGNGAWSYAGFNWTSQNPNDAVGLYVDEGIRCSRQFILSDRRIKKDIIDINDEQALLKLRLLKPKRYKYIDPQRGTDEVYGFIAQEVAEVIPYSVNLEKSYIPSHMVFCKIITTTTTTTTLDTKVPHNLTTLDIISFRNSKHNLIEEVKVLEIINDKTVKIDKVFTTSETTFIASSGETETNVLFLYGKKVNDLHAINKDTIWTTATAALQEVDRQLQAEKSKNLNLTSRLEALEARIKTLDGN